MYATRRFAGLGIAVLFLSVGAFAQPSTPPDAADFSLLGGFPSPVSGAAGVSADVLGDGSLIVYDGESIHIEDSAEADAYSDSYSGYTGDPGFVAVSPNGTDALVSAGASGELWLFDSANPANAGDSFWTLEHAYAGEFLGDDTALVDRSGTVDTDEGPVYVSELGIVDLSLAGTGNTTEVYTMVVDKPAGTSWAGLVVYNGNVYAGDGNTGQVRAFTVSELLAAWTSGTPLAWTDGDLVGTFNAGGPQGVSSQGTLLIGGIDAITSDSSVQFVDTSGGIGGEVVIPQTSAAPVYGALYNAVTSKAIVTATSFDTSPPTVNAYVSNDTYEEPVPPLDILQIILDFLTGAGGLVLILLLLLALL